MWKCKEPRIATTLKKNNKVRVLTLPDFKTYYKATTVIKTVWYWHNDGQLDSWDRIKSPKLNFV